MSLNRRAVFKGLILLFVSMLAGCGYFRIDPFHVLIRSSYIETLEQEKEILSRARVGWTNDGRMRVLYLQGTPYERGYQHGALLRKEVQENLSYLHKRAIKTYRSPELFVEAFERARPFIPEEYLQEMHGLAHGAKLPLRMIHDIHILPSLTEWGGKRRLKDIVKQMMSGELGTSCSNIGASGDATQEGKMYAVRVLDWGLHRISKLHQFPLVAVHVPSTGHAFANIGWVGFIGAVSGMNEHGITLGEMGYGSPPNETLAGRPMPFVLRDILSHTKNLTEVQNYLREYPGDNSFVFLMSDGKAKQAELYIKDKDRFLVFPEGAGFSEENVAPIRDAVYGGHFNEKMTAQLTTHYGRLSPDIFMREVIPDIAMKSNFQNVVYDPEDLVFWVSNARSKDERAAEQPYTYFDLRTELAEFQKARAILQVSR